MYRLVLESLLGLRLEGDTLRLSPCIPADWPGYRVRYRFRDTVYALHVRQEHGHAAAPRLLRARAEPPGLAVPLAVDQAPHVVGRRRHQAAGTYPPRVGTGRRQGRERERKRVYI